MQEFSLRRNGFILMVVAVGAILILTSLLTTASILIALSKGIAIRTFITTRSIVLTIVSDAVLPLIGGILLIVAGLMLFRYEHRAFYRSVRSGSRRVAEAQRSKVLDSLLSGDEKRIMALIGQKSGGALQSDIVIRSGYSKVKVHRILKGLETKGVIRRGRFGITNKVMLS